MITMNVSSIWLARRKTAFQRRMARIDALMALGAKWAAAAAAREDAVKRGQISRTSKVFSAALRQAIRQSGESLYRIAAEAGLHRSALGRFVSGKQSLRLDLADRLASYLGVLVELELTPKRRRTHHPLAAQRKNPTPAASATSHIDRRAFFALT